MTTDPYALACAASATGQGLDPAVDILTAAGVPCVIEQTGGFCMVLGVYYDADGKPVEPDWSNGQPALDYAWMTSQVQYDAVGPGWLVGFYKYDPDEDDYHEGGFNSFERVADDQLAALVGEWRGVPIALKGRNQP